MYAKPERHITFPLGYRMSLFLGSQTHTHMCAAGTDTHNLCNFRGSTLCHCYVAESDPLGKAIWCYICVAIVQRSPGFEWHHLCNSLCFEACVLLHPKCLRHFCILGAAPRPMPAYIPPDPVTTSRLASLARTVGCASWRIPATFSAYSGDCADHWFLITTTVPTCTLPPPPSLTPPASCSGVFLCVCERPKGSGAMMWH